jgi:cephalosporin hydroxylase
VAALAIANDLDAQSLYTHGKVVLDGLLQRGIKVIAYACDGTAVERSVRRLIIGSAPITRRFSIKYPDSTRTDISLDISFMDNDMHQPITMIQDPKHLLKTFRNNLFSGARLLVLGNYIAMYSHARTVAFEDGPLYHRDVEKLDRQDDNAATRLFSGHTLRWIKDKHPEALGW